MLIFRCLIVISVVSLSCLASAFSTLFVTEGVGGERKMEETETRTPKVEQNNAVSNQVIVETIPFFTDIFTKVEDVMNLTPLKVATLISAQHLINTVKSIPLPGGVPQDTLGVLSNIVDEFNKTTQIIKLTAEYVNISSHYILDSLNRFAKYSCDEESVKNTMKTINNNFLSIISNHVKAVIREIAQKTEHREMTGTDVLVSSAYHIVAAFQEMTNQVMALKIDNNKCTMPKTQLNNAELSLVKNNDTNNFESNKHDVSHKSIKKDQALPSIKLDLNKQFCLQDTLTSENTDKNPDLTIEIYPRESLIVNKKYQEPLKKVETKIPESLKVAFLSDMKTKKDGETKSNRKGNIFESVFDFENGKNKITKKNLQSTGEIVSAEYVNPNEELTFDLFPTQFNENNKKQESSSGKINNLESLKVFYFPLKSSEANHPNFNRNKNLGVPDSVNINYYPQNFNTPTNDKIGVEKLKEVIMPFKTLSFFGNPNFVNYKENIKQKKEPSATKSEGLQTNFKNLKNTLKLENLNRQDLTLEVFSPEAFMLNGKDDSSVEPKTVFDPLGGKETKYSQKSKWNFRDNYPSNYHGQNHFNQKYPKIKNLDRELTSSAVDSLSNVPPKSYETVTKNLKARKAKKLNGQEGVSTVLMPWNRKSKSGSNMNKNRQKQNLCNEKVEPVCGIDKNRSNFIIFPNDCQRKHHNNVYKTNYEWANMDVCIRFLLNGSSGKPKKYMNIIPR